MSLQKHANSPERLPLAYATYCVDVDEDSFFFINQAIYVLLMHGFGTLHKRILGRHKN